MLGQVWYLIVLFPDFWLLSYFYDFFYVFPTLLKYTFALFYPKVLPSAQKQIKHYIKISSVIVTKSLN